MFDVIAVGSVAGMFSVDGEAAAVPDVEGVFTYHSASADAVRFAAVAAAAGLAAVLVAAFADFFAPAAAAAPPRPAPSSRRHCPRYAARALERPELEDQRLRGTCQDRIRKLQLPRHQHAPDDVSVKIAGTCFMSLNCT